MPSFSADQARLSRKLLIVSLTWIFLAAAPASLATPAGDESAAAVVTELEGIRAELKAISQLLQTLEKNQQVTLLMTRIRLKQQRLTLLESQLGKARGEQESMQQELEQLEAVEESYFSNLDRGEYGSEPSEELQREYEMLKQRKSSFETRIEGQRAKILELENDLTAAREDVLALEETVDERLGLR